ncbi:hypothetical protein GCM10027578_27100 [Spirosoma luteolum]
MTDRYALHRFTNHHTIGFAPADYSRFKFGDGKIAQRFGQELARGFLTSYVPGSLYTEPLVVLPSPYSCIPTASYWMAQSFLRELNRAFAEQGRDVADSVKISRSITYRDDYGNLTREERLRLIGNDTFWVDPALLTGKRLIFIDDIRITGSHQAVIERMMAHYGLTNSSVFVYYGELVDDRTHPNIENYLNYYAVNGLADLLPIIRSGKFCINTRLVKYILNQPPISSQPFLESVPDEFLNELYDMALGNRYHQIAEYSPTLHIVSQLVNQTQYLEA